MTWPLIPFVALWRWWLGRGEDGWPGFMRRTDPITGQPGKAFPGATYIQYAIELAGVFALLFYISGLSWNIALTGAVGALLLARGYRHGPVLSGPGEPAPTGTDLIWSATAWIGNAEVKWWAYAIIRYPVFAMVWAGALVLQGDQSSWLLAMAATVLIALYRIGWAMRAWLTAIAPFYKSAGHIQYVEIIGWAGIGAALMKL